MSNISLMTDLLKTICGSCLRKLIPFFNKLPQQFNKVSSFITLRPMSWYERVAVASGLEEVENPWFKPWLYSTIHTNTLLCMKVDEICKRHCKLNLNRIIQQCEIQGTLHLHFNIIPKDNINSYIPLYNMSKNSNSIFSITYILSSNIEINAYMISWTLPNS